MDRTLLGVRSTKIIVFRRRKQEEFKSWHAILLIGILLTASILGILQRITKDDVVSTIPPTIILNEETCRVSGGNWNACGSACRTEPDAVCIEICVEYCECQSDDQCPFGYSCVDLVDGVGVCE